MKPALYKYEDVDDFLADSLDTIESFIAYELEKKEIVKIALSGGSSPKIIYKELANSPDIDWARVELYIVDERHVPLSSRDSNYNMIEFTMLQKMPNLRMFYSIDTGLPHEKAAEEYESVLLEKEKPLFDLVILGLGADGHTASLFPGSPALKETKKLVVATEATGDAKNKERISLTLPAIMNTEKIVFLIRGAEKEQTVDKLMEGADFPATKVLEHEHVEIFYDKSS